MLEKHTLKFGFYEYYEYNNTLKEYLQIKNGFYYSKEEFCKLIEDLYKLKKQVLYIFAHSQSFDFRVSVDVKLLDKNFKLEKEFIESCRFIAIYKHKIWKRRLIFLDSMNYFRTSIEKLGESLGIEKIQVKDFRTVSDKRLKHRCKVDVEILRETIFKLIEFNSENDCGKFGFTIASQSFIAFRHKYMKHKIYIHHNNIALDVERKSYVGGRTEAFKLGVIPERSFKVDENSIYPERMKNEKYPTKLVRVYSDDEGNIGLERLDDYLKDDKHLIICDLLVKSDKNCIPLKDNENHRLLFPVGKFRVCLCEPEIKLLLENGSIEKIYRIVVYESKYIFTDYVNHFYNKRLIYKDNLDKIFEYFTKIFMNSLYGKFGQKSKKWIRKEEYDYMYDFIEGSFLEFISKDDKFIKLKFIGKNAFQEDGFEEFYNGSVAISSFVTSYARVKLYRAMVVCKIVFYVDTDSIFTNIEGYLNLYFNGLLDDIKLGFFKVEDIGSLEIFGLKDYVFNKVTKIKGIKKDSVKLSENRYKVKRVTGFNESLRYFDIDNIYFMENEKVLKREYKKGIVEGNDINPIELDVNE